MSKIIFTNVDYCSDDIGNAGDYWASPLHYYDFPFDTEQINFVEFCNAVGGNENLNHRLLKDKIIVVGGGGLITPSENYLQNALDYLINNNKVIIWALGSNTAVYDNRFSWDFMNNSNIIMSGVRDIVHGLKVDYLPCVSAKHKVFDKYIDNQIKGEGIGILEHVDIKVPIEGVEKIKNNESIENIISFIESKEYLLTTTYHGLYWAQLLGKKVAYFNEGFDINSKFINIKNRVSLCNRHNYELVLENSNSVNGLIKESRFLNDMFYKQLIKLVNNV